MPGFTPYSLAGLRKALYAQADWAPQSSSEGEARVDQFINRAYYRLMAEAPFLFFEDNRLFPVYKDVVAGIADDLQMAENPGGATKDPWVLESVQTTSNTTTAFEVDGRWGGRTIWLLHAETERWHKRRIREVWTDIATSKYYISLDEPWFDEAEVSSWRIDMGSYVLPQDAVEIKHLSEVRGALYTEIELEPTGWAEEFETDPSRLGLVTGALRSAYRQEHRSLQAPTFDPTAATVSQSVWQGPEPYGSFEYCFTYAWGYQAPEYKPPGPETQDQVFAPGTNTYPVFHLESPPSSHTSLVSNASAGEQIQVQLPNVDFVLGFDDSGTRRNGRSGVKKVVYRRRVTSDAGGALDKNIETPEDFYPIAVVDGDTETWTDDGSRTPDYSSPLMVTHGYQTLQFWPRPDRDTQVRMRALFRPKPLTDPNDFPRIHEDAVDCLLHLAMVYLCEAEGNLSGANYYAAKAESNMQTLTKRYTSMPTSNPRRLGLARVRHGGRTSQWMRIRRS